MRIRRWWSAALAAILAAQLPIAGQTSVVHADVPAATSFYVAPNGNDAQAGTMAAPFATLERARDAIRSLKAGDGLPDGGVTVYVRGGTYARQTSFELEQQDSGTAEAPIRYAAYNNEQAAILGGKQLNAAAFEPVTDSGILSRLPEEAQGKVVQIDLPSQGVSAYGQLQPYGFGEPKALPPLELFIDDVPMPVAKWPNEGFVNTGTVIDPGSIPRNSQPDKIGTPEYVPPEQYVPRGATFTYSGNRQDRWTQANDAWLFGYWAYGYAGSSLKIESIDTAQKRIKVANPHVYGVLGNMPYYAFNLLEEIDVPGEWYLDRQSGKLYVYPISDISTSSVQVSLLDETMVKLTDVSHVSFEGLTFGVTRGEVFQVQGGSDNKLAGLTIKNTGSNAVAISGERNGIESSDVYNTGEGGIQLSGGDRQTLTPAANYARNNHVFNYARINASYTSAIGLNGVGNIAANNVIHDSIHLAMQFIGNDHLIERNEIYNVLQEADDMGAIYSGRDFTRRGNVIRGNYFHDLVSRLNGAHGVNAIYLDDSLSGTTIVGNVFEHMKKGVFINGGRDNIVGNNIMYDVNAPVGISDINSWGGKRALPPDGQLASSLTAVPYNEPPYDAYPHLANILNDEPRVPKYNEVTGNVFAKSGGINLDLLREVPQQELYQINTIEDNISFAGDPGFVDAATGNYELAANSPVYAQLPEFEPIPFAQIGLYTDSYRTALPTLGSFGLLGSESGANPTTAKFSWEPSLAADGYRFVLASDAAFQHIVRDIEVTDTNAAASGLTVGQTYYWKVQALTQSRVIGQVWNEGGAVTHTALPGGNTPIGPSTIYLGRLFDDAKDVSVAQAVYTDTFAAKADGSDLGVERIMRATCGGCTAPIPAEHIAPFNAPLQITPSLKFNYASVNGNAVAIRDILNSAWGNPAPIRTQHTTAGYDANAGKIEDGIGLNRNSLITFDLNELRGAGNYGDSAFVFKAMVSVNDSGWGSEQSLSKTSVVVSDATGQILGAYGNGAQTAVAETSAGSGIYQHNGTISWLRAGSQWGMIEAHYAVPISAQARYLTLALLGPDNSSGNTVWSGARLEVVVDKTALQAAIVSAQQTYDTAVEGTDAGQYPAGSRAVLQAAIDSAQAVAALTEGISQQLIDLAEEALLIARDALTAQANVTSVLPLDALLSDLDGWDASPGMIRPMVDGSVVFEDEANTRRVAGYAASRFLNEQFRFRAKLELDGGFQGFALRAANTDKLAWSGNPSYLLVVKADKIELQKWRGGQFFLAELDNDGIIESGQWHEIQFGSYNTAAGVQLVLKVDGQTIISVTDTANPIAEEGYFVVYESNESSVALEPIGDSDLPAAAMSIATPAVVAGRSFAVEYGLSNVAQSVYQPIYAQELTFRFDPERVEYESAEADRAGWSVFEAVYREPGTIRLIAVGAGPDYAMAADGPVLRITFAAKPGAAAGATPIELIEAQATDGMGRETPVKRSYVLADIQVLSTAALQARIDYALALHAAAVEGDGVGEYTAGSKSALYAAIGQAQATLADAQTLQPDMDAAVVTLNAAIAAFEGSVNETLVGDANGDGRISLGDLGIVAAAYGKTQQESPDWPSVRRADVNGDGVIDLYDLVFVAMKIAG